MKFKDIPGNETLKTNLRTLVDTNRLPHAIMLQGQSGIGKVAIARALVQYLHCTGRKPDDTDSCGECMSCRHHQALSHIDTHYIYPVVKNSSSATPPIAEDFLDRWRDYLSSHLAMDFQDWTDSLDRKTKTLPTTYVTEAAALIHRLNFATHNSSHKAVIWWLPEKMNEETANKLLKILEEPFADTVFIMVSDNPELLLPTILSRLQRHNVKSIHPDEIARYLVEHASVDPQMADSVAYNAQGSLAAALRALRATSADAENFENFKNFMRMAYQRKIVDLRVLGNKLAEGGRDAQVKFYDYAIRLLRENFLLNFNLPQLNHLTADEHAFSSRFAPFITERNIEKLIEVFTQARNDIAANANAKIVNLDTAVKTILLIRQ